MVCCDTSFLRALYGVDVHPPTANAEILRLQEPLVITSLNLFEFGDSVRFAECRKLLPTGQAAVLIASLRYDLQICRMIEAIQFNPASVLIQANLLSGLHTLSGGHRSFDILHVAAAVHLQADTFLTFDLNQRALAFTSGLTVRP